jgi:hypothetical protein
MKTGAQKAVETSIAFDKMVENAGRRQEEFQAWYDKLSKKEQEEYCQNLYVSLSSSLERVFGPLRKAGMRRMPKRCGRCKGLKQTSEFHKDKNRIDGYHGTCKACRKTAIQGDT